MAVAVDATGTLSTLSPCTNSFNVTGVITVGTGSNRALIATISLNGAISAVTCNWDTAGGGTNQSMTSIGSTTDGFLFMFGLVAPTSGAKQFTVTCTGLAGSFDTIHFDAISFTGVNQTGGTTSFAHANVLNNQAATTNLTNTVTSATGDMVVALWQSTASTISALGQTSIYLSTSDGANRAAGASPNVTMTATQGASASGWDSIGVDVVAAGAGFVNWGGFDQHEQKGSEYYPPARRSARGAALAGFAGGIEFPFQRFKPAGWEIQPPQPPHPPVQQARPAAIMRGDDGIQFPFQMFRPSGWEVQPFQPPHRNPEQKGAAIAPKEDGTLAKYINYKNSGWEIQPFQPPFFPKTNQKIAALSQWEDDIEAKFVFTPIQFVDGWEMQPFQPPFFLKTNQKIGALSKWEDGAEYPLQRFFPGGWEIQPFQPPHTFVEKRGAILRGDDGIEYPFQRFFPGGWEIQPPQPLIFPKTSQKIGALSQWEDGIESPFVFISTTQIKAGWEIQPPLLSRAQFVRLYYAGLISGQIDAGTWPPFPISSKKFYDWLVRNRRRRR